MVYSLCQALLIMIDTIKKWLFRKWGNWEIYKEHHKTDINYKKNGRIITTLKRTSNDGKVQYKTVKNY